jgi:hypothetical protein
MTEFDFDLELTSSWAYQNARSMKLQSDRMVRSPQLPTSGCTMPVSETSKTAETSIEQRSLSEPPEQYSTDFLAALLENDGVVKLMTYLKENAAHMNRDINVPGVLGDCKHAMIEAYERLNAEVKEHAAVAQRSQRPQDKLQDAKSRLQFVESRLDDWTQPLHVPNQDLRPVINFRTKPVHVDTNKPVLTIVNGGLTSQSSTTEPAKPTLINRIPTSSHTRDNRQLLLSAVERAAKKLILEGEQERELNTTGHGRFQGTLPIHHNIICEPVTKGILSTEGKVFKSYEPSIYEPCSSPCLAKLQEDTALEKRASHAISNEALKRDDIYLRLMRSRGRKLSVGALVTPNPAT